MKSHLFRPLAFLLFAGLVGTTPCQATCYYLINISCESVFHSGTTCYDTYCTRTQAFSWTYYCPWGTTGHEVNKNSYSRAEEGTYESIGAKGNLVLDAKSPVVCVDVFNCEYKKPCTMQSWIFGHYHCEKDALTKRAGAGAHGDDVFGQCDPCEDNPRAPGCGYGIGQIR